MGLTRKRKRELNRLREHAEDLWGDQREVLEHASQVVREAKRQAGNFAREEVSPKMRETLDLNVKPAVAHSVEATKHAVTTTRDKLTDDVLPAVSSALGSALAAIEVAKDQRLRDALKAVSATSESVGKKVSQTSDKVSKKVSATSEKVGKEAAKVSKKAIKAGTKAGLVKKKSPGAGRYILIGVVVVALAGIAYAAWQTLRADDDLWVDEDETPDQERSTPVDDTV